MFIPSILKIIGLFLSLIFVFPVSAEEWPDHVSGTSWRVVDGDTIHIDQHKIRLLGIDTPEMKQQCQTRFGDDYPCGRMARDLLVGLLESSGSVWCQITGRDRYQRLLGQCFAGTDLSGLDVQYALVRAGFAVAEYTPHYKAQEQDAKKDRLGMWRGRFLRPRDWRRQN